MKTIDVIYNGWQMKQVLRRLGSVDDGRFFIVFGSTSKYIIRRLTLAGWKKVATVQWENSERENFLNEYIQLIDQCGAAAPDQRIWWATYVASKNRFASGITELLQQFLTILRFSQSSSYDHLILISPSWTTISAVHAAMGSVAVQIQCPGIRVRRWREALYRRLRYNASLVYQVLRLGVHCLQARFIYRGVFPLQGITTGPWYVMKSFVYDHSFKEDTYQDASFGPLLPFLQQSRRVIIFGTILGRYAPCLKRMRRTSSVTMIPVELMFRLHEILRAAWTLLRREIRIQPSLLFFGYEVGSIVNNELMRTVNGIDLYHYLHYDASRRFLQCVTPVSVFLYTYENNPWERMCVLAFRRWSPLTRIIGYQQNVVPQAAANLFIGPHERQQSVAPDRVFTTGEIPKRILEKNGAYEPGCIQVACGLRFSRMIPVQYAVNNQRPLRILVAMEGIIAVYKMVNMVLRQLGGDRAYCIRLRAHPVLSIPALRRYLVDDLKRFPNVEVSHENTLAEDIGWADIVIYWGSTVALESLAMGKRLVCYDATSILSYDPLFECSALKRTVCDDDDLRKKIQELVTLPNDVVEQERRIALEYTRQYIVPVTEKQLSLFIA